MPIARCCSSSTTRTCGSVAPEAMDSDLHRGSRRGRRNSLPWQFDLEHASRLPATPAHRHFAAHPFDQRADNVQPEPRANLSTFELTSQADKTTEDLAAQIERNAWSIVGDAGDDLAAAGEPGINLDMRRLAGVFDRVVDQIA